MSNKPVDICLTNRYAPLMRKRRISAKKNKDDTLCFRIPAEVGAELRHLAGNGYGKVLRELAMKWIRRERKKRRVAEDEN